MSIALLVLLIGTYLTFGILVNRYGRFARLSLLGVSAALPGLAYFFL